MKILRNLALLAIAMTVPMAAAHATILNGAFSIDVYQGAGLPAANSQANTTNPLLATTALYSGTYTGDIDFFEGPSGVNNILHFLQSAGGSLSGVTASLNTTMSTGGFVLTTLVDITWTDYHRLAGTIRHDDGASLYLNGGSVVESAAPTSPINTAFGLTATGGNYRLIYAAANGLPEQLQVDITQSVVPEPTTLALLAMGGLFGLARMRARRKTL